MSIFRRPLRGPAVEIDWRNQKVSLHRMSSRRAKRVMRWIAQGDAARIARMEAGTRSR